MIFSITPNPALDLGGIVKDLKPNEKSYVFNETRSPGGNSINAARILSRLKIPVSLSGFLGGSTGDEIESMLRNENLDTQFIKIKNTSRVNVTVSNNHNRSQTRLSFPGPTISSTEKKNLFQLFERQKKTSFFMLGGSLSKGFTAKDIVGLIKIANRKGIKSIIDCPGSILSDVINAKPFFIKPNLEEFQELTNSHVKTIGAVIQKAKPFLDRVPYVCISSVEKGTLLVGRNHIYFGHIPKLKIRSTVGAGDSMVGAMVSRFYKGDFDDANILKWGLAASAATLSEPGMGLGHKSAILRLYKKVQVTLIK